MYLSTCAMLDALLPWQPNSPTSIKCLRPGAGMILLHFFSLLRFFHLVILFFFVYVLQVRSSDVTVVVYAGFFFLFINNVYKQSLLGCVITMVRKYQEAM